MRRSRGLGDVYKRQLLHRLNNFQTLKFQITLKIGQLTVMFLKAKIII
jgi:hypothetical protein